ncbi:cupin-like domain-containing protein [Obelidium mucronatum]|nr:cupin-like domain-containing protein [Obelidium mucronatum]
MTNPISILKSHVSTTREFGSLQITEFDRKPTAIEFLHLVSENKPAIFKNTDVEDWKAMESFTDRNRVKEMVDSNVTVSVTPNGFADAVIDGTFCLPHEVSMSMGEFFKALDLEDATAPHAVHYIQSQNNNMREGGDFTQLFAQVPPDIDFATEALGILPDAVNFWCGSRHSVTSFHKDHYENLYVVITGSKTFTLIPPSESWALEERTFPTSKYTPAVIQKPTTKKTEATATTTEWKTEPVFMDPNTCDITTDEAHPRMMTRWCSLDPTREPDAAIFRERIGYTKKRGLVLTVTLERGDMLYLPSLWAHKVEQGDKTMAVNYWYDMSFGKTYQMHRLLRMLAADAGYMEPDEDINETDGEEDDEEELDEMEMRRRAFTEMGLGDNVVMFLQ